MRKIMMKSGLENIFNGLWYAIEMEEIEGIEGNKVVCDAPVLFGKESYKSFTFAFDADKAEFTITFDADHIVLMDIDQNFTIITRGKKEVYNLNRYKRTSNLFNYACNLFN